MNLISIKQFDISKIALFIALLGVIIINYHYSVWNDPKKVIINDIVGYYAYLPSTIIYNDLTLEFLKEDNTRLGPGFYGRPSPTGNTVLLASYGMSFIYLPFFLIAHLFASLTEYTANGYSVPYKIALVLSSIFYLTIGAIFLRKLLVKYFSRLVSAITLLIIIFSTNILWYASIEAPMTHVYSFSLISVFLFTVDKFFEKYSFSKVVLIGFLVGLISLIRPTNIIIVLILILWNVKSWNDFYKRILFFLKKWYLVLVMLFLFIIVWSPQFLYWKYITGSYIFYSYPDDQGFYFTNPQLLNVLVSWRKGLFLYTPVTIFSVIGFFFLLKNNKGLFWPVIVYSIINWYIISSWWDWWYGGSFGLRPFIDSYSLFAIGLASFLTWVFERKIILKISLITIFVITTILSTWHFKRYLGGSIHWVAMTKEAYFNSFWRASPAPNFYEKLRNPDYKLARKGIYKYEDETSK